jgi:hypothetical protein
MKKYAEIEQIGVGVEIHPSAQFGQRCSQESRHRGLSGWQHGLDTKNHWWKCFAVGETTPDLRAKRLSATHPKNGISLGQYDVGSRYTS